VADDSIGRQGTTWRRNADVQKRRALAAGWQRNTHEQSGGDRAEESVFWHPQLEGLAALAKGQQINGRMHAAVRSGQVLTAKTTSPEPRLKPSPRSERLQREVRRKRNA